MGQVVAVVAVQNNTKSEDANDAGESGDFCENVSSIADQEEDSGLGHTFVMQQKP